MFLRYALAAALLVFAFSAAKADADIIIRFTPQAGPAGVSGALDGTSLSILQWLAVDVKGGTVADATDSISVADVLSVTVRLDGTDYTYDAPPTEFNNFVGGGLSDDATSTFGYFLPTNGGQNIQIADGASVFALNGTTVKTGGIFSSLVGGLATTFNGGAQAITAPSFIEGQDIVFDVSVVPEPTSFAMFGIFAMFGMARRRRKP